ncbi:hypothetical protein Scep_003062 [Stephania cephalantha]|uniref:Pentatricopeptide repeat-containing protein n=1 Tax=Stephania cephalantha TaxID=152367 RepID=A0AAP0PU31_9MAGN
MTALTGHNHNHNDNDNGDLISYSCSVVSHVAQHNPSGSISTLMWNALIRGFSQSRQPHKAFSCYSRMMNSGGSPDNFTYPTLLKACSRLLDLRKGQQVHSHIIQRGLGSSVYIDSTLLFLYTSCGELGMGNIIFEGIPSPNLVTWNAMISGCVRSGRFLHVALHTFNRMRSVGEDNLLDNFSLASVASACATMGALVLAKCLHGLVHKTGFFHGVLPLANSMLDMYGKCGSADDARKLFDQMTRRNVVSWSTLIDVYATHGHGTLAIATFVEMESNGVAPDDMTFTSLLCACNHSGLFQEGQMWFHKMRFNYGVTPTIQHYGCMVDLLGKAGRLEEAYKLIKGMPLDADAAIWNSLAAATLYHNDLNMARKLIQPLQALSPEDPLVTLSNVYARLGRWDSVETLRRRRRRRGIKTPACSFLQLNNVVHQFSAMDTSHPQSDEIYHLINTMTANMHSCMHACTNWIFSEMKINAAIN